jgi:hypothetical protein
MGTSRLDGLRSHIPSFLKRPVRRVLDAWDTETRWRALQRHVRSLRADVGRKALPSELVADICDAWGNKGFAADVGYVTEVAKRVFSSGGPFLDCGSGLSTIVAGAIATQRGSRVISLEQDLEWFSYLRGKLTKLGLSSVELIYAPLRGYDDFAWFDIEAVTFPSAFTHVFCDGPAVWGREWADPMRSNWRAGVVPLLQRRGIRFDEILLDDSDDRRCERLRETWRALGVESRIVDSPTGGFVLANPIVRASVAPSPP